MEIQKAACASCGAPISVPDDLDHLNCSYCGAGLDVRRGEGYIATRLAEDVKDAIEESGEQTQTEIRRLGLQQQLATAQLRLSDVQTEIRALQREQRNRQVSQQLNELRRQELGLINQIESLHRSLSGDDPLDALDADQEIAYQKVLSESYGDKDWTVSFVLCLLLGIWGGHRYYTGHVLTGILQFMTFGGFGVWWLIDLYLIGSGKFRDTHGYLLANPQLRFGQSCATSVIAFVAIAFSCALIARPIETQVLGLIDDAERLGPLATAGVVMAFLVGIGVFLYRMDPQAGLFKPLNNLINRQEDE